LAQAQAGSLAATARILKESGIPAAAVAPMLECSLVSPVLTAHPTEARRKTLLDVEGSVARLLTARDGLRSDREIRENETQLKARIVQMWQTRLLRVYSLTVGDEIENALSYYHTTFLREIPRLYAELEERFEAPRIAPFFRMGSWIGGDRDGNPNVNAETLKKCMSWGPTSRCRVRLSAARTNSMTLPSGRATRARIGRISPIGAP